MAVLQQTNKASNGNYRKSIRTISNREKLELDANANIDIPRCCYTASCDILANTLDTCLQEINIILKFTIPMLLSH